MKMKRSHRKLQLMQHMHQIIQWLVPHHHYIVNHFLHPGIIEPDSYYQHKAGDKQKDDRQMSNPRLL